MKRHVLQLSLSLYVLSMLLPTLYDDQLVFGWYVWLATLKMPRFLFGGFGLHPLALGLLANASYLLAVTAVLVSRHRAAVSFALLSCVAAVATALFVFVSFGSPGWRTFLCPGYPVWALSFMVLAKAAVRHLEGWAWAPLTALRADSLRTELGRAVNLAVVPAFVLSVFLCPRAADLFGSLLIPPSVAMAGSLTVFCLVAALCWRLSRPRPVTLSSRWDGSGWELVDSGAFPTTPLTVPGRLRLQPVGGYRSPFPARHGR